MFNTDTRIKYSSIFKKDEGELRRNLGIHTSREVITLLDDPTSYDWRGWEDACLRRGVTVTPVITNNKLKINIVIEL